MRMFWSCKPRSGPPLPGFFYLRVHITAFQDSALYPRLIIGPVLKQLNIWWYDSMDTGHLGTRSIASNMLSTLGPALSTLTSFNLTYSGQYTCDGAMNGGIEPETMLLYRSLCSLQIFEARATHITSGVLSYLTSLPNIKKVHICIHTDELSKFNGATRSTKSYFSALWIETERFIHVRKLLDRPGYQLRKLRVAQGRDHGAKEVELFLAMLKRHSQMEVIELVEPEGQMPSFLLVVSMTERAIIPSISLLYLVVLDINLGGAVKLNDGILGKIAKAWPHLETLNPYERTTDIPPETTVPGLTSLASSCPRLKKLCLRFDALDNMLIGLPPMKDIIPAESMDFLDICTSKVEARYDIIAFIETIFPNLSSLSSSWFYMNDLGEQIHPDVELDPLELEYHECWVDIAQALEDRRCARASV